MKQFEYIISEAIGIHARPASMLVKVATVYESSITIERDGNTADVRRLLALMASA
jgi:phosphocarrier protein